jgi:N-acetylmuramoyl-L-alanine amidase
VSLPGATGDVKAIRNGYFEGKTPRLVLEVPSTQTQVTSVNVGKDQMEATVGRGASAQRVTMSPDAEALIRMALNARSMQGTGSRGSRGNLPFDPIDGGGIQLPDGPQINPVEPPNFLPGVPARSLAGKTIVLDAGHGGHDVGAKGTSSHEADLCLGMIMQFKRSLEARGANVVLTRASDDFVSLEDRCRIANNSGADLFISIHCNSMPRPNMARGSEAYYYTPQSQRLAHLLHRRVVMTVQGRDGGVRNHRRLFVCRNTQMPSVLLEIGFINSVEDERFLVDSGFHGRLAESLAKGVLDYFGTDNREASGQ